MKTLSSAASARSVGRIRWWTPLIAIVGISCLPFFNVLADEHSHGGGEHPSASHGGGGSKAASTHQGGYHAASSHQGVSSHHVASSSHVASSHHVASSSHVASSHHVASSSHVASSHHVASSNHAASSRHVASTSHHVASTSHRVATTDRTRNTSALRNVSPEARRGASTNSSHQSLLGGTPLPHVEHMWRGRQAGQLLTIIR